LLLVFPTDLLTFFSRSKLQKLLTICNCHCDYGCGLQICDFGLAKWRQQAATQTTIGKRRGTVAYMAPEVFRDPNSPRTVKYDVCSFGILLWEILSEKTPFENGTEIVYLFSDLLWKQWMNL